MAYYLDDGSVIFSLSFLVCLLISGVCAFPLEHLSLSIVVISLVIVIS